MGKGVVVMKKRRKNRRRLRKTPIVIFLLIIAIIVGAIIIKNNGGNKEGGTSNPNTTSGEYVSSQNNPEAEKIKAEANEWYLMLVNNDNPLPLDFVPETVSLPTEYYCGNLTDIDARIAQPFMDMCDAAKNDGVSLRARSPYRSIETQLWLFNNEVTKWKNAGFSEQEAEDKAATVVARPGTSEHASGLAIDINLSDESFEQTEAFAWLQENAADYGFILRYPEDKQDITGIIYESWHYRYVTPEHAKLIKSLGLCLEEYVEKLKNGEVFEVNE